jgi:hypothetical protein
VTSARGWLGAFFLVFIVDLSSLTDAVMR